MIQVVPHDPAWAGAFAVEAQNLRTALGDLVIEVHHIGSTAVPGLAAKPIVDILVEVAAVAILDEQNESMRSMGYEVMGEYGIAGRRYFRKGGDSGTYHVHAFTVGDANVARHIAFRDYLRANARVAAEYGSLKTQLADACDGEIARYCDGKDAYVKRVEAIAMQAYVEDKTS